ncbi:unnamed protein product [Medioppia subpectinata]|uniref:Uncharacterized protein n=1 Tax=Medioppia subpectinata TaxID=1979941 RepID=A0A7R9KXY2_9ACAR|nr:unnamed protein product [Medioppia subpectinata]CAG2111708.1 unnamed protein product [Medioppia subpectinata]
MLESTNSPTTLYNWTPIVSLRRVFGSCMRLVCTKLKRGLVTSLM